MMLLGLSAILKYYGLTWMWLVGVVINSFFIKLFLSGSNISQNKIISEHAVIINDGGYQINQVKWFCCTFSGN